MKDERKTVTLYNMIFPVWLLVWMPYLWIVLIPANYLIDRLVFTISAKKQKSELTQKFFRKHTWKLCISGFFSDFVGSLILLLPLFIEPPASVRKDYNHSAFGKFMNGLQFNAFSNPGAFLYTLFAIAVAGVLIYLIDGAILKGTKEFTPKQAKKIAFWMAIITAPYLYLFPASLLYY